MAARAGVPGRSHAMGESARAENNAVPIFCSYYTLRYTPEAEQLLATLREWGLRYDVRPVSDLGRWELNCNYKPTYLRECRERFPGEALVWVDADARVRSYPGLFDVLNCDFAAHWRHGQELLSGTLYFGPTEAAGKLLSEWEAECKRRPGDWDQRILADVLGKVPSLKIARLPWSYCQIFDGEPGIPVIEHTQASRRLRG